jgi:RimJ/RimL family protein N-acetyltransferase
MQLTRKGGLSIMRYFKKLEGPRVYLSPINLDDVEIYADWINNLSVSVNLNQAKNQISVVREREILEGMAKEGYHFAIVSCQSDELLGNCSLFNVSNVHGSAEIGIFIGEEQNRGKGYGTDAMKLLIAYGFKILNLNNIMLRVYSFNESAIKAYLKVGFKEFGRRHASALINRCRYDEIYMEILSADFKSDLLDAKLPGGDTE